MIYIIDEKRPYAELRDQLDKTQPLTKEQVVDLIISKINGKDEVYFNLFIEKYERESFSYNSSVEKYDIYLKDFNQLEEGNFKKGTWLNPSALRSDLLKTEFSYYYEYGKTILYNRQIEDWCYSATNWLLLCRKRVYLTKALNSLKVPEKRAIKSSYQKPVQTDNKRTQGLGKDSNEKPVKVKLEKKIPEKWFALLHMIYVNMDKYKPFEDFSNKKIIVAYGKENYPIKGTGQMFYKEIKRIYDSKSIYNYIHKWVKKDFWKWKRIITEISKNDPSVKLWIDRNQM